MAKGSEKKTFVEAYQSYITAGIDLIGGTVGGTACVLVGQPLDTLKVKMQTFPHLYKNSFDCFKQTVVKEKFIGLYVGTVPALAANIAKHSVLFCAYGVCQNAVKYFVKKENIQDLTPLEDAGAGFVAAFVSSFSLTPTELIKCRLQAMRETSSANAKSKQLVGPWMLTKEIFKNEGILGFYRGFGVTALRESGYFFLFGGYELTRILLTPEGMKKENIGPLKTMLAGGVAGVSFWLTIFPIDVAKSILQVSNSNDSTIGVIKKIIRKEDELWPLPVLSSSEMFMAGVVLNGFQAMDSDYMFCHVKHFSCKRVFAADSKRPSMLRNTAL